MVRSRGRAPQTQRRGLGPTDSEGSGRGHATPHRLRSAPRPAGPDAAAGDQQAAGQKQRPPRARCLQLADDEIRLKFGRCAISNPLHAMSDLQRRGVPIQRSPVQPQSLTAAQTMGQHHRQQRLVPRLTGFDHQPSAADERCGPQCPAAVRSAAPAPGRHPSFKKGAKSQPIVDHGWARIALYAEVTQFPQNLRFRRAADLLANASAIGSVQSGGREIVDTSECRLVTSTELLEYAATRAMRTGRRSARRTRCG